MSNDSPETPPRDADPDELPGESHLQPRYCPEWGNSNPDFDDGQIHLEGEFDFPADQPAQDVAESFADRAETIGGIVSHSSSAGHIDVYPWNGPGFFRLTYDPDDPEARIDSIVVFDRNNDPARHETVSKLKDGT
jgi:hypothetical protein